MESAAGDLPIVIEPRRKPDLQATGRNQSCESVQAILEDGNLNLQHNAGDDAPEDFLGPFGRCTESLDVGRFQMRRCHQSHRALAGGQARHAASCEPQTKAREIPGGPAVEDGLLQARHKEILHHVTTTGSVGKLQW